MVKTGIYVKTHILQKFYVKNGKFTFLHVKNGFWIV